MSPMYAEWFLKNLINSLFILSNIQSSQNPADDSVSRIILFDSWHSPRRLYAKMTNSYSVPGSSPNTRCSSRPYIETHFQTRFWVGCLYNRKWEIFCSAATSTGLEEKIWMEDVKRLHSVSIMTGAEKAEKGRCNNTYNFLNANAAFNSSANIHSDFIM